MCFIIDKKHPDVKTAEKDIVCYKRYDVPYDIKGPGSNGIVKSPYQGMTTHLGAHLKVESFSFDGYDTRYIEKGLHSYESYFQANYRSCSEAEIIVKCIIPKGTQYYYDSEGKEYVSLELKLLKSWRHPSESLIINGFRNLFFK